MKSSELFQRLLRRAQLAISISASIRKLILQIRGARIGRGTRIPKMTVTWPHQISLGKNCVLEEDIYFKFDGPWQRGPSIVIQDDVFIGRGCEFNIKSGISVDSKTLIASGCKFIDHDHEIHTGTVSIGPGGPEMPITLQEHVWLGANVIVLMGVTISRGAVVGAGAVVTKSIGVNEIWAGVPARKIGMRSSMKEMAEMSTVCDRGI